MTPRASAVGLAAALIAGASFAQAANVPAATCAADDVQTAIDSAVDGDIVRVPPGECTWTEPVAIGVITNWNPMVYESQAITLAGAGMGQTVIDIDMDSSEDALSLIGEAGKPARVTGLTFTGARNEGRCQRAIVVGGQAEGWRIDRVEMDYRNVVGASPGCGIGASGVGVIDQCRFENVYTAVASFGDGDASWERPLDLGSCDSVYVEDNEMNNTEIVGDGATDGYGGARYVFRHNRILNARAGHHGLDSGGYRSPHSFEIYNNDWEWTDDNTWYTWRSRGGTGVIFGNTITGAGNENASFGVVNYRTCCCHLCTNQDPPAYGSSCDPFVTCADPLHENCGEWGRCDGTSPIDGNTPGEQGYPCMDQTGRSTDMDDDGIQDLEPLYEWDNVINGANADVSVNDPWGCADPAMADHIQEGRDFHNDTERPDYAPCAYPHPLTEAGPVDGLGAGGPWEQDDGCGCRLTGRQTPGSAGLALLALGTLLGLRRRW